MTTDRQDAGSQASRREFLKTTAAAGGALAANLSMLANVHAAGDEVIKVGVIGCGGRGRGAADNVLHAAPNVKVVAIGDVFQFATERARRSLQALVNNDVAVQKLGNAVDLPPERCFTGLDAAEKVINSDANYIILATPPGFRPPHIEMTVAAGKNLFTEKPVGVDGPGIRKVLAAYEDSLKKGLHIAAGTQRRHQTPYIETIKRIHDGEIGDITAMRCFWNGQGIWFHTRDQLSKLGIEPTDLAFQLYNWYHFVWTCGDHIVEQHVHNLDVCNWAMGNKHPVECLGMGSRLARPEGTPNEVGHIFDNFAIDYVYDNGVHMLSMCRHIPNTDGNVRGVSGVSEAVVGSKGFCQVDRFQLNGKTLGSRRGTDPYVQEHTDLIESIRGNKPLNELKNVAQSTLTAIMGRMSAYTGKAVTWDKALNSKLDTMPSKLSWDMALSVPPVAQPGKTPLV